MRNKVDWKDCLDVGSSPTGSIGFNFVPLGYLRGYRMKVLLGKSKVGSGGRSVTSFQASIPLVVAENLHVTVGSELFIYLEGSRIYIETVKRDESSYGIYKEACYLGSKSLATQGAVLCFSFAHVLREGTWFIFWGLSRFLL